MQKLKIPLILLAIIFFVAGCKLDQGTKKMLAYAAGKGMAITINKLMPGADTKLTAAWQELMKRNAGKETVPAGELLNFYQKSIMILSAGTKDPYGMISDLSFFMASYGGQFAAVEPGSQAEPRKLIAINDIPMIEMQAFGYGYSVGRQVALQQRE